MFYGSRTFVFAATLAVAIGIGGCALGPGSGTDSLDARLAWPCERLVVAWAIDAGQLQEMVGKDVTIMNDNGVGQLQLSVMQCDPPRTFLRRPSSLLFAYVTVPVKSNSVPLVITSVPADGWSSLVHLVADANSQPLFSQLGYDVLAAGISFAIDETDSGTSLELQLTFDNGHIAIAAKTAGDALTHEANRALLSSGTGYLSAFFGEETAQRYPSASATVRIEGETPLSRLKLPERPAVVACDKGLRSDRIFWRLPNGL